MDRKQKYKEILNRINNGSIITQDSFKYNIHTPYALCAEILKHIDTVDKDVLVLFNIEFLLELNISHCRSITFLTSCDVKEQIASKLINKENIIKISSIKDIKDMNKKFDVVIGNPPFQMVSGNTKISIGTTLIKQFYNLVKENGILTMVSANTFLGGGQKGLGYIFSENKVISLRLNHKQYFPKIGIDIGSFIIQKLPPENDIIEIENQGSKMTISTSNFIYNRSKRYIPRNINAETLPILEKIIRYNKDIFDFRASDSKGSQVKIGFFTGPKIGIIPKYFRIAYNGDLNIGHPCKLDQAYSEDNIKSIFCGKLFHWVISIINGNSSDGRPANLSFFPKVRLDKKWTFDELCNEFKLTDQEKQIIVDWAKTKSNWEWFD